MKKTAISIILLSVAAGFAISAQSGAHEKSCLGKGLTFRQQNVAGQHLLYEQSFDDYEASMMGQFDAMLGAGIELPHLMKSLGPWNWEWRRSRTLAATNPSFFIFPMAMRV